MQDLKIGDRVICVAVASVGYEGNRERKIYRDPRPPFHATITGQRRKMLGQYQPGGETRYSGGYDPPDPQPPYLEVSGSVLLWCVRKHPRGAELLIADDDLTPLINGETNGQKENCDCRSEHAAEIR